jgi:hypothetical protein
MTTSEMSSTDHVVGLVGGLGVGAAIHYYREFAAAHDDGRQPMTGDGPCVDRKGRGVCGGR